MFCNLFDGPYNQHTATPRRHRSRRRRLRIGEQETHLPLPDDERRQAGRLEGRLAVAARLAAKFDVLHSGT